MKLALRIALASSTLGLLASCTTSQVSSLAPTELQSKQDVAEATAAISELTGDPNAARAAADTKAIDLATNKTVKMARVMPQPSPADAEPQKAAMEVASADPALAAIGGLTPTPVIDTSATTSVDKDIPSVTTALVANAPKTRAIDVFAASEQPRGKSALNGLISKYAEQYGVPEKLVHHVVRRESNYNPTAVHRGNWGLMQIRYNTARGMGYKGTAQGLLDAETNLKYAVKYLRGAWLVADRDAKKADWLYRTGYYYHAKRKGLLEEVGLR